MCAILALKIWLGWRISGLGWRMARPLTMLDRDGHSISPLEKRQGVMMEEGMVQYNINTVAINVIILNRTPRY